ncbi:MAG: tetratricopeptide repeat protein [Gemmatimonadota bacterium]
MSGREGGSHRNRTPRTIAALLGSGWLLLAGCGWVGSDGGAAMRGDQAFARGDLPEALAEYRLGLRQSGESVDLLMRTAHTYARLGRISDAEQHYRDAVALDPSLADLASADLLRVARRAVDRNDGIGASTAVAAATQLRPGVSLTGVALPLARHFAQRGQYGQALPFFEKAVQESSSDAQVVFEMALAHEALGDCERALVFLERVRDQLPVASQSEVDWNVGNCSSELAREAQVRGDLEEALEMYQNTITLGEPRNRVAQAWFEIGEILASRGECSAAVRAFEQAAQADQASPFLVDRARDRIDDIRFSRSAEGPC